MNKITVELSAEKEKPWQIVHCLELFSELTPERRVLVLKMIEKQLNEQESD